MIQEQAKLIQANVPQAVAKFRSSGLHLSNSTLVNHASENHNSAHILTYG